MDNDGFEHAEPPEPPRKISRSLSTNVILERIHSIRKSDSLSFLNRLTLRREIQKHRQDESSFEFMECGTSPPPSDPNNMYTSFEDSSMANPQELTVQICHDTIRTYLIEHMKKNLGRLQLLDDIADGNKITKDNLAKHFSNASPAEINTCFLWSAFMKRWDLLEELLELGANLQYYEPVQGMGALHLSSFSGCVTGTQFLIKKGFPINATYESFAPLHCAAFGDSPETAMILLKNGAEVNSLTSSGHHNTADESVLHCAIRANATACVKLLTAEGACVNQVHAGMTPIHLAADLGHLQCLGLLLDSQINIDINAKTDDRGMTALHFAAEGGFEEIIDLLLKMPGVQVNIQNSRGQTPLLLAARAQSFDCVEKLLKKNANPNLADIDLRSPLHAAVGKSARSTDILEILIKNGADINKKDQYGYTPLHIAALNELSQSVDILIYHGADVTAKTKYGMSALGMITRKTPGSIAMINQKLDAAITLHFHPARGDLEMRLDFRSIHQHPLEISALNVFVDDGQKELLLHPVCSAFLFLKWEKIRKLYFFRILFYLAFILFLSLYVLSVFVKNCPKYTQDGKNVTINVFLCEDSSATGRLLRNDPLTPETIQWILIVFSLFEMLRKVHTFTNSNPKDYFKQFDNYIELFVIVSVFVLIFALQNNYFLWHNHIGAFAILGAWTNLMLLIGQLPNFGSYIAMYTKVQGEFAKLLLAYLCLLFGFTISFCVIFPLNYSFSNIFLGFITVITFMTGELDRDILNNDNKLDDNGQLSTVLQFSSQITFLVFIFFITVTLMNLLVGIAVHDIQGLQKTAELSKLVRQTKLIAYMELALFEGYRPKYFLNLLKWSALVSPNGYRVVLNVKPLNPREKRLPLDILKAAYALAKQKQKHYGHTLASKKTINDNNINICDLQAKVNQSFTEIEKLSLQIKDIRDTLNKSHNMIEQLLLIISNRESKC